MMRKLMGVIFLVAAGGWSAASSANPRLETVVNGLEHPWSVAFLPDGRMLVTERPGRLRVVENGKLRAEPVSGLPKVFSSGQSGLYDVLLAEDFGDSGVLYLSFVHGDKSANHTRIVRARFDGRSLSDVETVFTTHPAKSGDAHNGGRMLLDRDGTILMGLGDGFFFREESQKLESHMGTIVRVRPDGSVPADNPFVGRAGVLPHIYSYGHRHVQAIVRDPHSGRLYAHEHGPRGGDELNLIAPGRNYGWPLASFGRDYSRALITPFTTMPGMEQPLLQWTPSIAPAGMALYEGTLFPEWRGDLFVAALAEKSIRRVRMDAGVPVGQEVLFADHGQRMRDVRVGPDGALYLLTDEEQGALLRVVPR